ncbi:MAG: hypothetical protein JXQ66_01210 [Campylobacterales bacterium]|nr:hypothetical protein [Campylobacterales bacterium]
MAENAKKIDWDEFKDYKKTLKTDKDNFGILLDFIRSYYNLSNVYEMFNMLKADELAKMMLDKRGIDEAAKLESYLYRKING